LYRLDPRARKLDYLPLTTLDGDVAVPPKLKKEESTVRKRLLEAGFEEEFIGEDRPPATHYHYGKRGGFYAEFLAPLEGSEYDRNGKRKATKEVGGVSSQLLRYIEILLLSPWKVELGHENGYALAPTRKVQVANPVTSSRKKSSSTSNATTRTRPRTCCTCTMRKPLGTSGSTARTLFDRMRYRRTPTRTYP
jgi:Nucleotidyltransferase